MRLFLCICVSICAAFQLNAQANSDAGFEALSRRAAAALESDPAEAAKLYRQAIAIQPSWAEGWFYFAASLFEIKQYRDSTRAFQRAAQLAPENGTVWAFLGLSEYETSEYAQALADIRKGEQLGLSDNKQFISSVRNHAALIYLRSSEFGSAMEQLQPLATIADDSPATIDNVGISALGLSYLPPSVPSDKKPLVELAGRAWWALSAQRDEEARSLFEQLVTRYPNEPGVHYLCGLYLVKTKPDAALQEFHKELEIRPSHVPARLQAAAIEIKAGASEAAVKLALEAVSLQPANPYCYVALGRAYLSLGQVLRAAQVLETAAKLAPENRQPHLYLAQAYRRAGRVGDAEKEQAEFARLKQVQDPLILLQGGDVSGVDSPANVPVR